MPHHRVPLSRVLVLPILLLWAMEASAQRQPEYQPGELIIRFREGATLGSRQAILADLQAQPVRHFAGIKADRLALSHDNVAEAIARYQAHPDVVYIEPNYIYRPDVVPNDPRFESLWGMRNVGQTGGTSGADIKGTSAWNVTRGSSDVLVAIIDSGVDYNHPDLVDNIFVNTGEIPGNFVDDDGNGFVDDVRGWDFAGRDNDPMDVDGHGTHVAGTVGAVGNNGVGVAGVNWEVRLLPVRFLGNFGGTTENAILAIDYSILMGAKVINASWGGAGYSEALRAAIQRADASGIVFAAASGNEGLNADQFPHYPASYDVPGIVSVAATDHNDNLASFSNYGVASVDLGAPGVDILSTFPNAAYGAISGTSMATPHVTGALALIHARYRGIGPLAAKNALLANVDPRPSLSGRVLTGGRLDAFLPITDPDSIPPGPVVDLAVTRTEGSRLELSWTATGDDGAAGAASRYDVRYSTSPIDADSFQAAVRAPDPPDPLPAGSGQSMGIGGLAFSTTYHVALRAFDEFDNAGPISNVAQATTGPPPDIAVSPASLSASLLTGQSATHRLTVSNSGASELTFVVQPEASGVARHVDVMPPGAGEPEPILATGSSVVIRRLPEAVVPLQTEVLASGPIDRGGSSTVTSAGPGRLVLSGTEEVFGGPDNAFLGGPRMRGNIFECTTARILSEHRIYLDPRSTTQLWFLVYEGAARIGTFNLVSASNATPAGPGPGWYSSGPVQVRMEPGRFYMIVASFEERSIYFNRQGISPYPVPASFGSLIAALGWDWAPPTSFPPDPSLPVSIVVYGSPIAYYQTLITEDAVTWLVIEPGNGAVGAGETRDIEVTFDAAGMIGGDYDAEVVIRSNDPDEPEIVIPAHLHVTGAPDIEMSPSALDFGAVFLGGERSLTLEVINRGTDVLSVGGATITPSDFTMPTAGFTLAAGERRPLVVSYRPTALGPLAGSITFQSSDPDDPVVTIPLAGSGLEAPDIGVTPTTVSATLLTGQSASRTVTIQNTGGNDLTFSVGAGIAPTVLALQPVTLAKGQADARRGPLVADGRGGPDVFGYRWRDSDEAGGPHFEWVEISGIGTVVPMGGDDWNSGPLPIGFEFPYYGQSFSSFRVCSNGWLSFTSPSAAYRFYPLPSPFAPENLLAVFWSDLFASSATVFHHNDGSRLIVEWRNVSYLGGYTPFTFQIQLYLNGRIVYQYLSMGGTQETGSVGIQNATQDDGLTIAFNTPYVRDGLAIEVFAAPPWLSATPAGGTVPVGGQLDLEVRLDAAGMAGGQFNGVVTLDSNDPDESRVLVAAQLNVTGAPDIDVAPSAFEYDSVFVLLAPSESLLVHNLGSTPLQVTGIETSRSEYTVDAPGGFTLAPRTARVVMVTFAPTGAGPVPATLGIRSDDPDEAIVTVTLAGTGVLPPDLAVAPESLSVTLASGETTQRTLILSNAGSTPLDWAVHLSHRPSAAPLGRLPTSREVLGPMSPSLPRNASTPAEAVQAIRAVYGAGPGAPSILLYSDDYYRPPGAQWGDLALQARGLSYTAVYNDPNTFAVELGRRNWDLIVVNHENYFDMGSHWGAIEAYLGRGGRAVLSTFDIDGSTSMPTTLWQTIGLAPAGDLDLTAPIHWWDPTHPLFTSPERVPEMTDLDELFVDDGDRLTVLPGRDSPAGFVPARADGQSAIVIASDRSAIVNGFVLSTNGADLDHDNRPDAVELLVNEITLVLSSWIAADPPSGTVPPGGSTEVTVSLDASELDDGSYVSNVVVTSNDPDEALVEVPVRLRVVGLPDIAVEPASLDFGSLFVGLDRTESLLVVNRGRQALVVSAIDPSSADYGVRPADNLTLAPRESRILAVTFAPSAVGPRPATLALTSNDPDQPVLSVSLSGGGLEPPDLEVTPASLSASLGPGRRTRRTLTLANAGGNDLTFTVASTLTASPLALQPVVFSKGQNDARRGPIVTDGHGGPDAFGYVWKDSSEPDGPIFEWVEIVGLGTAVPLSGDDWNYGPLPIGFAFPFYGESFGSFYVCSNGWLSFTSTSSQYATYPLPSPLAPVNLLAAFWDDLTTTAATVFYHHDGTRLIVEWRNVAYLGGGPPFTFQIQLYPNGRIVYQYLSMAGTQTYATVGLQNGARDDGLTIAFNTPYVRDGLAIEITRVPPWLSIAPAAGTVPPGGRLDLEVGFDASRLGLGAYGARIQVTSNDPDEAYSTVSAVLDVRDASVLEVDPLALDFGETLVGHPSVRSLTLRSLGSEPVQVHGASFTLPEFTLSPAPPFALASGESMRVDVSFAPASGGLHHATLHLASNDPDSPWTVDLEGSGLLPPVAVEFDLEAKKIKLRDKLLHQRVKASITPPSPFTAHQIDAASIRINDQIGIDPTRAPKVETRRGKSELTVWFRRGDLALVLPPGERVPVTVTGTIGARSFVGHDTVDVKRGRIRKPLPQDVVPPSQTYTVTYEITAEAAEVQWVTLLGSYDGGENWHVELARAANTGQIAWRVPAVVADSALLAVVEVEGEGAIDELAGVLAVSDLFSIRGGPLAASDPVLVAGLLPISPNPSGDVVRLRFALTQRDEAMIEVFDVQGRVVRSMALGALDPGWHQAMWDGANERGERTDAGLYFVRLRAGRTEWTQRVVRAK